MPVLQVNSRSIDQKSGEICTGQADLQPIPFKSDRLLGKRKGFIMCKEYDFTNAKPVSEVSTLVRLQAEYSWKIKE